MVGFKFNLDHRATPYPVREIVKPVFNILDDKVDVSVYSYGH